MTESILVWVLVGGALVYLGVRLHRALKGEPGSGCSGTCCGPRADESDCAGCPATREGESRDAGAP